MGKPSVHTFKCNSLSESDNLRSQPGRRSRIALVGLYIDNFDRPEIWARMGALFSFVQDALTASSRRYGRPWRTSRQGDVSDEELREIWVFRVTRL